MKPPKFLPGLLLLPFFFFGSLLHGQTQHIITLKVNTSEIEPPDIGAYCTFGQPANVSNEEFTIVVSVGDEVVWQGVSSSNPEDRVEIRAINHQGERGGRDIFGANRLPGQDGVVRGTVLNTTETGADYKYQLQFRVYNNGSQRGGTYIIDPKIRVISQ